MSSQKKTGQTIFFFSLIMMTLVIMCGFALQQLIKSNDSREDDEVVERQHSLSLSLFNADVDFFGYDLNNPDYFKTGKSEYISRHDSLLNEVKKTLDGHASADTIILLIQAYDSVFDKITSQIYLRGYKNFGLEGEMRNAAHLIESKKLISPESYLTLRRHEKDYLLRSENAYVEKFDSVAGTISRNARNAAAVEALNRYSTAFHNVVNISSSIGLETQTGLKGDLEKATRKFLRAIDKKERLADKEIRDFYSRGILLFAIGIVGTTIVCFSLIVMLARRL